MKKVSVIIAVLVSLMTTVAPAQTVTPDIKGSKDHPLISRMPDFWISEYKESEFESYKFMNADKKPETIEGHRYSILYKLNNGASDPGALKITRNIQAALKKIGAKIVLDDTFNRLSTIVVQKDNKETWIESRCYSGIMFRLTIVEKEIMNQEIVADANAMGNDINSTGHVSLYGIFFDSGKSDLKSESDEAIVQISKLLTGNAALKLYVVGHTDNVGTIDANMKLSNDRANEVVKTLVANYGIAADRLKPYGVASLAPVASNDTEEGKAMNRRVELVKQ
jgi:outer membrane protein OmpA-like peptidoglycan-associated protein